MELYYESPMQVRYRRPPDELECLGIAFHEFVIDLENGAKFSTKEILERWAGDPDEAIIEWCDWVSLKF